MYLNGNLISNADWEGVTIVDEPEGDISGRNNGAGSYKAAGDNYDRVPTPASFNGDFCNIISSFVEGDLDPCAENNTTMLSFISEGQGANNDPLGPTTPRECRPRWEAPPTDPERKRVRVSGRAAACG